jgi:YD repeat-containing protein
MMPTRLPWSRGYFRTILGYGRRSAARSSISDPAGVTSFPLYDANGLIKEITDPFSSTKVIYTYDAEGRITRRTDGGNLCTTQTYEPLTGRVDIRTIKGSGTSCVGSTRVSVNLDYDQASNISRRVQTVTGNAYGGTYDYTYDEAGRLETVVGPAAFGSRTYTLCLWGRWLSTSSDTSWGWITSGIRSS